MTWVFAIKDSTWYNVVRKKLKKKSVNKRVLTKNLFRGKILMDKDLEKTKLLVSKVWKRLSVGKPRLW